MIFLVIFRFDFDNVNEYKDMNDVKSVKHEKIINIMIFLSFITHTLQCYNHFYYLMIE